MSELVLQQFEAQTFDQAIEILDQYRIAEYREPTQIDLKFTANTLPSDVLAEFHAEAEALGVLVTTSPHTGW
jgi:hypothetical protein